MARNVYRVFAPIEYEGDMDLGYFSTRQKARRWIRRTAYNRTRMFMKDPRHADKSLRWFMRELMADRASHEIDEQIVDPEPTEYK